jgi:Icc-related predicted phosphoesterase
MPSLSAVTANIASASGSVTDRRYEFAELARCEDVNFIVGDWMSEYNMTTRGGAKVGGVSHNAEYEDCFLESILPALEHLHDRGIKVAVNAGASDTEKLHDILVRNIADKALNLKVAWVEGDEVFDTVQKARANGVDFCNLTTGMVVC